MGPSSRSRRFKPVRFPPRPFPLSFSSPRRYPRGELPVTNPLVAFVNVNVIPMDSERVLENQTVIVRDGAIDSLGTSDQLEVPREALAVDGRGKYLMPGLVDMHVHIQYEDDMLLWIANGVTSVRNMWGNTGKMLQFGFPDQLALRKQIEQDSLFGPSIHTAGPVMEGSPPFHPLAEVIDSPELARESIAWQKAQGYDFIKVYDHLSPEVYKAIIEAARENDIPVVGHVPFAVGLDGALASGQQTIEHLTGYIDPILWQHSKRSITLGHGRWPIDTALMKEMFPNTDENRRNAYLPALAALSQGRSLPDPGRQSCDVAAAAAD